MAGCIAAVLAIRFSLASKLFALNALRHTGGAPAVDVFTQPVVEEECTLQRRGGLPAAWLQR